METLEVRHLRLVRAIVDEGSLTRASERLFVTQSALSHQLRDLEGRLGTQLFRRVGKRLVLAPAGELLLRSARLVEEELARVGSEIQRIAKGEGAVLRVSTECYTCYHWLPAMLKAYAAEFPATEVEVVAEATRRPVEALLAGRLDVAIVSSAKADPRLTSTALFDDELVVVLAPDHPLARRAYVREEDFEAEHLIMYDVPEAESTLLNNVLGGAGVRPRRVSRVQLTEAILELVRAGLGISVFAQWAVAPHVESGALVARRLTRRGVRRTWRAVTLPGLLDHDYARAFVHLLGNGGGPGRGKT
jgi:LysR family transcriptional regulator for metE and metH